MNETPNIQACDLTDRSYWSKRWNRTRIRASVSRRQPPAILKEILNTVRHSGSRPSVCEIGCAPGSMLLQMATLQPDYEYCGVDYSQTGLATTREILKNAGEHAELVCEDYFKYLPSEPFDLVVSFGVIEHATNALDAIRRHVDFAREGGFVAISIPNYGSPLVKWMAQRVDPCVFKSHNVDIMSSKTLEEAMLCAGLSDVAIIKTGKPKMRTTCPNKTFQCMCWRTVAKLWNLFSRLLPAGFPWSTTFWATGRLIPVQQTPAGAVLEAAPEE